MLRKSVAFAACTMAFSFLSFNASAQTVTGDVTDVDKVLSFQGAIVTIDELQRSVTTDDRGRFRITNVPAGQYTLVVSYVGVEDTRLPITVGAEGLAMGDVIIGGENQAVEEVIVYGQSAAVARALNQERSADNLVSVLDTDAMGQFPDQNVAESLNRLPGVTVETDQGEGRYVVIRGMDPDLNATSINGVRATAGEPRRALQLDVIPSDVLDGLEVHKTLTPDMDGDSIGGSINVKTLSAFSRKGPYVKARAEGAYNELREEWSPKLSFAGSNIFDLSNGKRLGVAGAISWNDRALLVNNNEADDWEVADNGSDFAETYEPRLYTVDRERIGGALNFDLDISDSTSLHLYTLYSKFTDTELRNATAFGMDGLDENTVTSASADFSEAEIERTTKDRDQTAENLSISLGSATQLSEWLIETGLGYSWAQEETPDQMDSAWVAEYESGDGPITAGAPVLTFNHANAQTPTIESNFWSALQDSSLYELDGLERLYELNKDEQLTLNVDFGRETGFGGIKFGLKARWREKSTNENVDIYSGDGTWFLSDVVEPNGAAEFGFPTPVDPVPNIAQTRDILNSEDGIEFEDIDSEIDSNISDYTYNEDVYSAYALGRWDTDRMVLTAGIRVEQTEVDNQGNEVEFIEEGTIVNGVPLADDTVFVTPVSQTNSYTDWLPSANIRYEFNEGLIGRASVYRSVVRPRVEEVAYRVGIEDNEGELGNPELDPFRAWNLDASIAYYPTELSVLSAGVFYKQIEDFIFLQVLDDYDYNGRILDEAVVALNGETADVFGVEIAYQQHFGFLGAPWDAFLIALNYTYVESEGDTGERKVDLPKQSANIGSFMLGYDKYGLDLRLALKYRDRYIDELVEPGLDRYTDDRVQWDFTAKYRFTENWQVYAEIANLGDDPEYYYAGNKNRLYQYDEYGTTSALGIQYNFQ
jgi:TonB-dependent receptor